MKITKYLVGLALLSILLLTGCVRTVRQPLSVASRKQIKSDQAVLDTDQREINPTYNPEPYYGSVLANLVKVVINHYANKKVNKAITPIRSTLTNYDFSKMLYAQLNRKLTKVKWLKLNRTHMDYHLQGKQINKIIRSAKQNTTLLIYLSYDLTPSFQAFVAEADVSLYKKDKTAKKGFKTIYSNQFYYINTLPKKDHHLKQDAKIWTANDGRLIKSALNEAAASLANMLIKDIQNPNSKLYQSIAKKPIKFSKNNLGYQHGKVIAKRADRYLIRANTGAMYNVNRNTIH